MRVAFPQSLRDYLVTLPVLSGVFWEHDGVPRIIIKLPETVSFSSWSLIFGTLHRDASSTFHVAMHMQSKGHSPMELDCLIRPAALPDTKALQALLVFRQIEVYAVSPTLFYLGIQVIPWSTKKGRLLASLAHDLLAEKTTEAQSVPKWLRASETEVPTKSPLRTKYRHTLHLLYHGEVGNLPGNSQQAAVTSAQHAFQTPLDPVVEEQLLAHAHQIVLSSRQATLLAHDIEGGLSPEEIYFPNHPCWIECLHPLVLADYTRTRFAVFCIRATFEQKPLYMHEGQAYYRTYLSQSRWRLDFVDEHGTRFLRLLSFRSAGGERQWELDPSHTCPTRTCPVQIDLPPMQGTPPQLCAACQREADFWRNGSNALLAIALGQSITRKQGQPLSLTAPARQVLPASPAPPVQKEADRSRKQQPHVTPQPPVPPPDPTSRPAAPVPLARQEEASPQTAPKPVIVASPLLIERYAARHQSTRRQEAVEQAHKYLWMQSAWTMTEALRFAVSADEPLLLPADHLYIELEQPRHLHGQQFAACSLLRLSESEKEYQRWHYSVIDATGNTVWSMFYEGDPGRHQWSWTVPRDHTCPELRCQVEDAAIGRLFHLCEMCQERATHYTSWLAIALRMLAGDFREQVEVRDPEEVLEASTRIERDTTTGKEREKRVLHRFKVIRYYDACVRRDGHPQTKRGSWMAGRPLAESEYEVNPAAIIYVLIQPRKHQRTYRHHRYIYMKGKTQQIDPKARAQPMTIATFRQLHLLQRMTKVSASGYE